MSKTETQEKPSLSISVDQLKELIEAVRKPIKTETEIRAEEKAKQNRAALAATLKQNAENKRQEQENCSHMRSNGSTTAVYVTTLNAMLCQKCGLLIRPEERSEIFNRLYQISVNAESF